MTQGAFNKMVHTQEKKPSYEDLDLDFPYPLLNMVWSWLNFSTANQKLLLVWGHSSLLRGMKYVFPLSHFFVFVTVNHSSDKRPKILRTYFESTFSRKCGWFTSFGRRCHKLKVRDMFQIHFLCFYIILGSRYQNSFWMSDIPLHCFLLGEALCSSNTRQSFVS